MADADFHVVRDSVIMGTGVTTLTLTEGVDYDLHTNASTINTFVKITNSRQMGMGATSGGVSGVDPDEYSTFIRNPENVLTSFTLQRHDSTKDNRVDYEIWSYIGPEGGDNEMLVRKVGFVSGNNVTTLSVSAVSTISDASDIVVWITGQAVNSSTNGHLNSALHIASLNGSNQPVFVAGQTNAVTKHLSYAVLEYTGSNWSVHTEEFDDSDLSSSEGGGNYSGGNQDNYYTYTLTTTLADTSKTFFHYQFKTPASSLNDSGWAVVIDTVSQVHIYDNNLESGETAKLWFVQNSETESDEQMIVEHFSDKLFTGGSEEYTEIVTLSNTVRSMSDAGIAGESGATSGGGNAVPRGSFNFQLTAVNQITWRQNDTNNDYWLAAQVVQFPRSSTSVTTVTSDTTINLESLAGLFFDNIFNKESKVGINEDVVINKESIGTVDNDVIINSESLVGGIERDVDINIESLQGVELDQSVNKEVKEGLNSDNIFNKESIGTINKETTLNKESLVGGIESAAVFNKESLEEVLNDVITNSEAKQEIQSDGIINSESLKEVLNSLSMPTEVFFPPVPYFIRGSQHNTLSTTATTVTMVVTVNLAHPSCGDSRMAGLFVFQENDTASPSDTEIGSVTINGNLMTLVDTVAVIHGSSSDVTAHFYYAEDADLPATTQPTTIAMDCKDAVNIRHAVFVQYENVQQNGTVSANKNTSTDVSSWLVLGNTYISTFDMSLEGIGVRGGLGGSPSVYGSFTQVQGDSVTTWSLTFTLPLSSGGVNRRLFFHAVDQGTISGTPTYGNQPLTKLTEVLTFSEGILSALHLRIWSLEEDGISNLTETNVYTLVMGFSGGTSEGGVGLVAVKDASQVSSLVINSQKGSASSSDPYTTSINIVEENTLVLDFNGINDDSGSAPGSGQTELYDIDIGLDGMYSSYKTASSNTNMSQTISIFIDRDFGHIVVAVPPAALEVPISVHNTNQTELFSKEDDPALEYSTSDMIAYTSTDTVGFNFTSGAGALLSVLFEQRVTDITTVTNDIIINSESLTGLTQTGVVNIESLQGVVKDVIVNLESKFFLQTDHIFNLESLLRTSNTITVPSESLEGVTLDEVLNVESKFRLEVDSGINTESKAGVQSDTSVNVESLKGISSDETVPTEALSGSEAVQTDEIINIEARGQVTSDEIVNSESLSRIEKDETVNKESLRRVETDSTKNKESLEGVERDSDTNKESLEGTSSDITLNLEALQLVIASTSVNVETLQGVSDTLSVVTEALEGVNSGNITPIESLEAVIAVAKDVDINAEAIGQVLSNIPVNVENLREVNNNIVVDVESLLLIETVGQVISESLIGLETARQINKEAVGVVETTSDFNVDVLQLIQSQIDVNSEALSRVSQDIIPLIEALQGLNNSLPVNSEARGLIVELIIALVAASKLSTFKNVSFKMPEIKSVVKKFADIVSLGNSIPDIISMGSKQSTIVDLQVTNI